MLDILCGRRRFGASVRTLPCSFWFVLLFAVGGVVLFIHLQDIADIMQQQAPEEGLKDSGQHKGMKFSGTTPSKEYTQFSEKVTSVSASHGKVTQRSAQGDVSPISPMQLPHSLGPQQTATSRAREPALSSPSVTKLQRKLLKTSPESRALTNSSSSFSSTSMLSTDSSSDSPPKFVSMPESLADIQESRRRLIREVCAKYRSNISRTIMPHHVARIYVEDRHKLLYCEVPKAGCSNWKRVLMVLAGVANSTSGIDNGFVHNSNQLKRLDYFDRKGITERLKTYTKILFIREPLERLVSAYRDKFESPNVYYHPVFGKHIIARYRVNASKEALKTGSGVTFQEFIKYLLDVHRPVGMDIHWEPANQLCNPCHVEYDFIGKADTMGEDANLFLRSIGAPADLEYPTLKDGNPKAARTSVEIMQQYFANLTVSERQRAYDFYYMDYLMFNYSKPYKDLY
ncbi:carbohydrate sulfotransferase 8-like isoform X1 [Myxocyprinus asiaticus]|uniref:carbohydrate sulfotransferase 8-like isoform X1 n=1 Tax=Myxocyprinus asiaticus TaxID=70543 RepID=UPI002223D91B|nr:carbohydrate sulfotransferase 8-like isoform X1 [Myxocyprinus asiaticus]